MQNLGIFPLLAASLFCLAQTPSDLSRLGNCGIAC